MLGNGCARLETLLLDKCFFWAVRGRLLVYELWRGDWSARLRQQYQTG